MIKNFRRGGYHGLSGSSQVSLYSGGRKVKVREGGTKPEAEIEVMKGFRWLLEAGKGKEPRL